jgi:CheY-like chemotaxis protein/purine-cytosine permease-like protein
MDLLTRGAGFGYIGSTVTSLIYASFTFIFFALEAAIMAYALELAFDIPPAWGYLVCALVVIPMVTHGVTALSRFQVWTQPLWLAAAGRALRLCLSRPPHPGGRAAGLCGAGRPGRRFNPLLFGGALTVGVALITQMGEQVDYLRFMPEKTAASRTRWWAGVLLGGPGWVLPGVLKMLGGALLATLALSLSVPADRVVDPNQMYLAAYELVFSHYGWAVAATALLVVVSQLKINVTNAYAGSLAWSNFFARVTHSHPGRVVWMVFNTLIALMLMELEVFKAIGGVLGLYSNIAISWIMAVVADLVVNKPLGLSPKGIEFRRAHLYDINPVGVGAMGAASLLSVLAHVGLFGPLAQAFSAVIAMAVAFVTAPLIAWATRGRYYLARQPEAAYLGSRLRPSRCVICERSYEGEDMARCPAYGGPICSLCCSLDARCHDLCKPADARAQTQLNTLLQHLLPRHWWPQLDTGLGRYLLLMGAVAPALGALLLMLYQAELRQLGDAAAAMAPALRSAFIKTYCALLLVGAVIGWWLVLAQTSRRVAQEESNRQTEALVKEIDSHRRTDEALQRAEAGGRCRQPGQDTVHLGRQPRTAHAAEQHPGLCPAAGRRPGHAGAPQAGRGRDPPGWRTPAEPDRRHAGHRAHRRRQAHAGPQAPAAARGAAADRADVRTAGAEQGPALRARRGRRAHTGAGRRTAADADPHQRAGQRRQVHAAGRVSFRASHLREMAIFEIEDTGPGIAAADIERIFEPFSRGAHAATSGGTAPSASGGTGLGLTIAKMLTDLMGGEMTVSSQPGSGTLFRIRLFLPELQGTRMPPAPTVRGGYAGGRRRILVVDNEEVDRTLLARRLQALGFDVLQAGSGTAALGLLQEAMNGQPVHAILMDLAMPGIDGWETIRTLRRQQLSAAPVAIVSANAFDKGLDNDVGITPADFITKPVRFDELLDWLGRQLGAALAGRAAAPPPPRPPPPTARAQTVAQLLALRAVVDLGYPRGVQRLLDQIEAESPHCAAWLAPLRGLAQRFEFDRMTPLIQDAIDRSQTA